ncbi:DUF4912 domain-containing protein [Bacillaceae bacterium IKA-2]|nr:DUF4912 domain-containing protein [Bacillaceae bacterium IKA-2]
MISEIIKLKSIGLTIEEIANELNLSVIKVENRLNKYRKETMAVPSTNCLIDEHKQVLKPESSLTTRPNSCSVDECVLMVQSPKTLFCYWSLSDLKRSMVIHHLNGDWISFQKKLRVYDITALFFDGHNAHRYQDYYLPELCNQWFFSHLTPNRTYCVDVGVETKEGNFFSILRSNPIDTPRASAQETGLFANSVANWKQGKTETPEWLEGFSSYSYYQKLK